MGQLFTGIKKMRGPCGFLPPFLPFPPLGKAEKTGQSWPVWSGMAQGKHKRGIERTWCISRVGAEKTRRSLRLASASKLLGSYLRAREKSARRQRLVLLRQLAGLTPGQHRLWQATSGLGSFAHCVSVFAQRERQLESAGQLLVQTV